MTLAIDDPAWSQFVRGHEDARPAHLPAWAEVLAATYGHRPFVFALQGADGGIAGGVPLIEVSHPIGSPRWVSLPFTDVCPPLLAEGASSDQLVTALDATRREAGIVSVELRAPPSGAARLLDPAAVVHTLQLDEDPARVFDRFHRSQVQRNIRRAEREDVRVAIAESEAELMDTYYPLHVATRRRLGIPVQPKRFFRHLWQHMLGERRGFLLLAYAGDHAVAGAVFLSSRRWMVYKYGASDRSYRALRPNHRIFWTAIRGACEAGQHVFDFGRTDQVDESLREFKRGWGAQEEPLYYSALSSDHRTSGRSGVPRLARDVIRRSPPWVCRAAGELLYRFTA